MPRTSKPARITLASIDKHGQGHNQKLVPFPDWESNLSESCNSLLNVLSMEIDPDGVMWILDGKRDNHLTNCPAKIVLFDLNSHKQLSSFDIPENVCGVKKNCFVNDIVVDGDFAYMSDTTSSDPGILVYNRKEQQAWKFRNDKFFGRKDASNFTVQGHAFLGVNNINGIALSSDCTKNKTFYFTALSSYNMYSISTDILKDSTKASVLDISNNIVDHGKKFSQSAGMVCDDDDNLYFGLQVDDAVAKWDTKKPLTKLRKISKSYTQLMWPDSATIDNDGNLYYLTNKLPAYNDVGLKKDEVNFRIVKWHIGNRGYFYCKNKNPK